VEKEEYTLEISANPDQSLIELVERKIYEHNRSLVGDNNFQQLAVFARDPRGEIVGGIIGVIIWKWLHISSLWVRSDVRRQGIGTKLLSVVETEAKELGCTDVFVSTTTYQTPEFYLRSGFAVFGHLDRYPFHYQRLFLAKML